MATRFTWRIFRGITEPEFCDAAEQCAKRLGGFIAWNSQSHLRGEDFRLNAHDQTMSMYIPFDSSGFDHHFSVELASKLNVAWMELRMHENALWDYSLYVREQHLHDFSTLPQYWDDDPKFTITNAGNVDQLCEIWGCEKEKVKKYIIQWKMVFPWYSYALAWIQMLYTPPRILPINHWYVRLFRTYETWPKGKAYPHDVSEYGDAWQIIDFLHAIGAKNPMAADEGAQQHRISFPKAK